MLRRPINNFLVALILFLVFFVGENKVPLMYKSLPGWLIWAGVFFSFLYASFSVIKGVKQIKKKENYFTYDLIAIIGGTLILPVFLFIGILFLALS